MEQEIKIKVNIPDGYEYVDFRRRREKELVLSCDSFGQNWVVNSNQISGEGPYIILRKKETLADKLNTLHKSQVNNNYLVVSSDIIGINYLPENTNVKFAIKENGKWHNAKIVKIEE